MWRKKLPLRYDMYFSKLKSDTSRAIYSSCSYSLRERAAKGQELSGNNPVYISVIDFVVKSVRFRTKHVHVQVAKGSRVSESAGAVEHLEVVCADTERSVPVGDKGRLQPEKRGIGLFHSLA